MNKEPDNSDWKDFINFRKQNLFGKVIFILSFLVLGSSIVINFLTNFKGPLSKYSIWILFGWFFLLIFNITIVRVISFIINKDKVEQENLKLKGNSNDKD